MRKKGQALVIVAALLLAGSGCSIFAAGSLFSPFSIFSLVPGPKGYPGAPGMDGTNGTNGTNGMNGADGSLRIYGDGSAGDVTVSQSIELFSLVPDGNVQFRNLMIEAGGELIVPSGTVLRCQETFTNNGALTVLFSEADSPGNPDVPGAGISHQPAGSGEAGDGSASRFGGDRGAGITEAEAHFILSTDPRGGGAGGPSGLVGNIRAIGAHGGGRVIILAHDSLTNAGEIDAAGDSRVQAAGGGGGGIVVLASAGPVTNTASGIIVAHGGNGGKPDFIGGGGNFAGGGGGGGGIVHLISPSITNNGPTPDVSGGLGGAPALGGNNLDRSGGGGGGASGGNGGGGGSAISIVGGNALQSGTDGDDGYVLQTVADPTALF